MLICQKLETNQRAWRSVVWFSEAGLSEPMEGNDWIFAESEDAYAAVRVVVGGFSWEEETKNTKGKWVICKNEYSPLILEVGQKAT